MIHSNDIFEMLSIMIGHNRYAKVTDIFPKKNLTIGQMDRLNQIVINPVFTL